MNVTILLIHGSQSEIVKYVATPATTVREVLDHVLGLCGYAKVAANWTVVFDKRTLGHDDLLSSGIGECGLDQDIFLLISAAEEPCRGPSRQVALSPDFEIREIPYRLQAEKDRTAHSLPWSDEYLPAPLPGAVDDVRLDKRAEEVLALDDFPVGDRESGGEDQCE